MPKYKNRNAGDEAYTTRVKRKGKTGKAVNKSTSRNTKKKG